ncbi:PWWP domain-containing protein 3-like [Malania oleifera]|uniref:PWWP domain-containing protein 3-like n=1 Tax=Malania oleifera TaxID=397392 RepID=UPI0025ADF452|nr:PWWP domain-containing protein 3-like [Malania oleifera]
METVDGKLETPVDGKTLDDSSSATEPVKTRETPQGQKALKAASAATGLAGPSLAGIHGNGVNVSVGKEGFLGGTEATDDSCGKWENKKEDGLGLGLGLGDPCSLKKQENGLGYLLGAKKEENGIEKKTVGHRCTLKNEVKDAGNLGKRSGCEDGSGRENGKGSLLENGEDQGGEVTEMPISLPEMNDEKYLKGDVDDESHHFSVGDLVWGKIRSHPWWPGQIYNPSDASEHAAKYKQRDRLLVAYFGDGSFAWCYPSQLEPFEEKFESMSQQSNSKSFVDAVQEAVGFISRLVELKMTCFCMPKEHLLSLDRSLAVNAGIRKGASVPRDGTGRLSVAQHEPAVLLANLRNMAQSVSASSMLELAVLKSWLSAFYCAKGGYQLPVYHEPQLIVDPEYNNKNASMDICGFMEVPIQGPSEEQWLSVPVGPGYGQTSQSLLQKCLEISEDKLNQRRKQKSMAELMGGDMDVEPENNGLDTAKEGTHLGKVASASGKKKRKEGGEAGSPSINKLTSPLEMRKRAKFSGFSTTADGKSSKSKGKEESKNGLVLSGRKKKSSSTEVDSDMGIEGTENSKSKGNKEVKEGIVFSARKKKKGSSAADDGDKDMEGTERGNETAQRRRNKVSSLENDGSEAKEEIKKGSLSRERKRSKYLSPPYTTNLIQRQMQSNTKRDSGTKFLKVSNVAHIGEQMKRAAGQLIGSPPILKCSGETFQRKLSKELGVDCDTRDGASPEALKEENMIIDLKESRASPNEVLYELRSVAGNFQYSKGNKSLDMIRKFFSVFRSSIYREGSNYEAYNKSRPGRKRKSLDSEPGSILKSLKQIHDNSSRPKTRQSRIKNNEERSVGKDMNESHDPSQEGKVRRPRVKKNKAAKLDVSKVKQAPLASAGKMNDNKTDGKASSAVLFVSFPPTVSLPSKDDLITIYSKFGALNEMETDILYNSFCGRVVFVRTVDAEEAFNNSVKSSPFGTTKVNFRLRYPSVSSGTNEDGENLHIIASCLPDETPPDPSATQSANEASELDFIKQKLEMMTLMLEKSDGQISQEMKSSLEGEMKGLLKKVSTMVKSSSS